MNVEELLAKWAEHHEELQAIRIQVKEAKTHGPVPAELKYELEFIERKCGKALDELLEAYRQQRPTN